MGRLERKPDPAFSPGPRGPTARGGERRWGLSNMGEWLSSGAGVILVGALLSLAVFSAVVIYLFGEWGDRRQRKRELKGLLKILDIEIAGNKRQLLIFDEYPVWITRAPSHSLQTRAWEDIRARLADLMKNDDQFNDIAKYYANIQAIDRYRLGDTATETSEEYRQQRVKEQLRLLLELSDIARKHIRKYVPDTFIGTPLRSLEEARDPEPPLSDAGETERRTLSLRWRKILGG